jgi:hypothetical protein
LSILLMSGQDLRPAHNPALPDVALLRKPFTRENWRRRCDIRVIEIRRYPRKYALVTWGEFLDEAGLCNAPRRSAFGLLMLTTV